MPTKDRQACRLLNVLSVLLSRSFLTPPYRERSWTSQAASAVLRLADLRTRIGCHCGIRVQARLRKHPIPGSTEDLRQSCCRPQKHSTCRSKSPRYWNGLYRVHETARHASRIQIQLERRREHRFCPDRDHSVLTTLLHRFGLPRRTSTIRLMPQVRMSKHCGGCY